MCLTRSVTESSNIHLRTRFLQLSFDPIQRQFVPNQYLNSEDDKDKVPHHVGNHAEQSLAPLFEKYPPEGDNESPVLIHIPIQDRKAK